MAYSDRSIRPATRPQQRRFATVTPASGSAPEQPWEASVRSEAVICPYWVGPWVATGFAFGLVSAPRPTRFIASIGAALTISDGLHLAYSGAVDRR